MLLVGVYGFAPYYTLHRFKQPFRFLRSYIVAFQAVILFSHLATLNVYRGRTITLLRAILIYPGSFWYVYVYVTLVAIQSALYFHPQGKTKNGAYASGVLGFINMLFSWGIIIAWMGKEPPVLSMIILFMIRILGSMSIMLPQFMWTSIFAKHRNAYLRKFLESFKESHDLAEHIPAYRDESPEAGDVESDGQETLYALELEGRSSVVHKMTCQEFIEKTGNGRHREGWVFPFNSYEEVFEYGSSLEGRSYPKTCSECRPWDRREYKPKIITTRFSVQNQSVAQVNRLIASWMIAKAAKEKEVRLDYFKAVTKTETYQGAEYSWENVEINLDQENGDTSVEVRFWTEYYIPNTYVPFSLQDVEKRAKQVVYELKWYIDESTKDLTPSRTVTYQDAFSNLVNQRSLLAEAKDTVEGRPVGRAATYWLIFFCVALIGVYVALFFFMDLTAFTENAVELLLTYGAAFGLVFWTYLSDRKEREPLIYILLMLCWGVFAGLIAAPLNSTLSRATMIPGQLVAPFVEEIVKALGLYVFLTHPRTRREFNSPMDGIIYGFTVGMGFYASENFVYFLNYDIGTLFIRILLCWGHGVWVAIVGLWIAVNRHYRGYNKPSDLLPGLTVAVSLHFLWNLWSSFGALGGRILLFQTFFQLGYLRKMINEAKSDEYFSGEDRVVFSPLDAEGSRRHSRTALVLVFIVLLGAYGSYERGSILAKSYSGDWEEMEFMGFSFQHPERLRCETQGVNESLEATEEYGVILFSSYPGRPQEYMGVEYIAGEDARGWRYVYYDALSGENVTLGEEHEAWICGHDCFYREFTIVWEGEKFNCVTSCWLCEETDRVFFVKYYTVRDDSYETWRRVVDSFSCHDH